MSEDVVSQQEVEDLLAAMPDEAESPRRDQRAGSSPMPRIKVTPYDFKRPECVGKEEMRALYAIHEGLARNLGVGISTLLQSCVEVKLTSVDQLTYSEFVFSIENPTCFNVLSAMPLEGYLILEISPGVFYPIMDRMLGGGREDSPLARRAMTEIELRLIHRVVRLFLLELRHAWAAVVNLEPTIIRVESNPQLVAILPPNEVVLLISFELTLAETRGMLNLCIPYNSLGSISGKLSTTVCPSYGKRRLTRESVNGMQRAIRTLPVDVSVQLAQMKITVGDLLGLRVGDVIASQKSTHSPLLVSVEDVPKFHASHGVLKGRKGIRVEGNLTDPSSASDD